MLNHFDGKEQIATYQQICIWITTLIHFCPAVPLTKDLIAFCKLLSSTSLRKNDFTFQNIY